MTRDDIIRMARETNASFETAESMFKFAQLVSATEREACAKVCEYASMDLRANRLQRLYAAKCANAIRARGQQ